MIVDLRSLKTRVTIGGQVLTTQFEEIIGSDDYTTESGIVAFKGSLKLCKIRGSSSLSLDDWAGISWLKLGSAIAVDIDLGSGYVRHPRGALFLQGTKFTPETEKTPASNEIEVTCSLGARSFREPVDETQIPGSPSYGLPGYIRPTHSTTAYDVVNSLFQLAGCGTPNWNTSQNFNLCDRPQLSGSYVESAGKILASMGLFAVSDGYGVIQIYPVESATLLFSANESELSDMERVLVGSPPAGVATVTGSYRICHDRALTITTQAETRGNIAAIVPGGAGYGTVSRTTITDTIDYVNSVVGRSQVETRLGFQVYKGRSGLPKASQVQSNTETGFKQYSQGNDAKLEYSMSTTVCPAYQALQGYIDWAIENKKPVFLSTSVQSAQEITNYRYDDRERLIEVVKQVFTPIGQILAGLGGIDWQKIDDAYGLPSEPVLSERETQQWQLIAPGEWRKVTIKEFSQCQDSNGQAGLQERLNNAKDSEILGIYRQAAACSASTVQIDESNSGQSNPPDAERFPSASKTEDREIGVKVEFQGFANTYDPRAKPYTCPHLPDVHLGETVGAFAYNYGAVWHGVALRRWQSVRVEMPYSTDLLNYRPYAPIEIETATGTYRLAMNGTSWAIGADKAMVSSDCSLIGFVPSPGVVIPPFMATPQLTLKLGFRLGLELNDYEPESATLNMNLGFMLRLNAVDGASGGLTGAIAQSQSLTGMLSVTKPLAGNISQPQSLSGSLYRALVGLLGAIGQPQSLSGSLTVAKPLTGLVSQPQLLAGSLSGGTSLQTETTSWISRVQGLGGDPTTAATSGVDAFFTTIKAQSYYSKLKMMQLFAGTSTIASAMAPLKHPSNTAATLSGFSSSEYTASGSGAGIQGNSSGYVDHNFSLYANLPGSSATIGVYSKTTGIYANVDDIGMNRYVADGVLFTIATGWSDGNSYGVGFEIPNGLLAATPPSAVGLTVFSRTSDSDARYYFNGTQYGIVTSTTSPMSSLLNSLYSFASEPGVNNCSRKLTFSFAATGLTPTEANDFTTAVNNLIGAI